MSQFLPLSNQKIRELLTEANLLKKTNSGQSDNFTFSGISCRSGEIGPGWIFSAISGNKFDGNLFIDQVLDQGASLILSEQEAALEKGPAMIVSDIRKAYALLVNAFLDFPSRKVKLIGITGTNGKTTTTFLVQSILQSAGIPTGVIGTTGVYFGDYRHELDNTTPDPMEIAEIQNRMVSLGAQCIVMEVSSHGIDQHRIFGMEFALGIFTNLTQDHLDYHRTMEAYANVKYAFFQNYLAGKPRIFNISDPWGMKFFQQSLPFAKAFGIHPDAEIRAENIIMEAGKETCFTLIYGDERQSIQMALTGHFNILNALAASAVREIFPVSLPAIAKGLNRVSHVPGRLEAVPNSADLHVFIDYAHTPDALENVLKTLRQLAPSEKIIAVFGCGGNRDKTKRPVMGKIAEEYADMLIVTNDNPRNETPLDIIEDIRAGFHNPAVEKMIEPDRAKAIRLALKSAQPGNLILIAGKGHEDYQIVKDVKHHFSDREEVLKYFGGLTE